MDKAVDSSGINGQLSTEKTTGGELFMRRVQRESRGNTGFKATQVLVFAGEMALIPKNGCHLLLLLCINRTIREERENNFLFLRRLGGRTQAFSSGDLPYRDLLQNL